VLGFRQALNMDPRTTWRSEQASHSSRSAGSGRQRPFSKTFHGAGSLTDRPAAGSNRWKEGWESFLQPSTPIRAAASLLTEEEFRKHPLSMQTTTASFTSARQTQHSTGEAWRVDFASQARQMGQEVLAALAAPTEPSPFDEMHNPEVPSAPTPRRPTLGGPARPKRGPVQRRTVGSSVRRSRVKAENREEAPQAAREEPAKAEAKLSKPGAPKTEAKAEAKVEAKAEAKVEAKVDSEEKVEEPPKSSAPSSPKNALGKKSLFSAVKALMQVAREEEKTEGQKLAQMLGAVTDRRSASPSVESDLQSRPSDLTDPNSSRRGSPEPGGHRKSNPNKAARSQTALVKAAAAFKSALSAVAGATDTTTGGNRRLSVAERMAMTSGSRPTDKDKESAEERSDPRQDKSRSPTKQFDKGGQEAEAKMPETPVPEFATQRRERGHGHWKWQSQPFEAPLCSFQELVNVENNPMPLSEAMERVRSMAGGQNFTWERSSGAYGGRLHISFPIVLWYQHSWENEIKKSRTSCVVSFVHKPGCAFVYQPTVPVTTLLIEPKQLFRPMFQFDPRSFHTFKLAWRHYLDFGSTDYRVIVGGELERWCQRCKTAIEKPFNAVYWLLLMIGSHYRESLASRRVVAKLEDPPEQVPIICIDSFVALSALLFSPERQVLYAGVDPTPSYLRWLQYIGDQYNSNKAQASGKKDSRTVFEMNEFLDFPAIIIFYGRPQQRGRESEPLAWVNSPSLIKSYIARYSEDNKCGCQLEPAARLYTYSCSLGCCTTSTSSDTEKAVSDAEKWYCWNGLKVCEIGVPVPHTQASFLSPFVTTRQVAFLCPVHGPDRLAKSSSPRTHRQVHRGDSKNSVAASHLDGEGGDVEEQTRSSSQKTMSLVSNMDGGLESGAPSEVASEAGDDEDSESRRSWSFNTQMGAFGGGPSPRTEKAPGQRCACSQYIHASHQGVGKKDKQAKSSQGESLTAAGEAQEVRQALSALGEYDLLHTFVAVMSGGLNMAKSVLRLHFSIDPGAYQNLPEPACKQWEVGLMPWYREFHRTDMHSRCRHGMLLASILRGMLGDGLTSGLHEESLDILRLPLPMAPAAAPDTGTLQPRQASRATGHVQTVPLSVAMRSHSFLRSQSQDSVISNEDKPEKSAEDTRSGSKAAPKRFLNNVQVCCALVGCESPLGLKHHFEVFNQWCHSAHLLPFVKRCYRRCGIAGLAAGQHVGHHKKGANPFYPLVLPTVPTVCYGHCYPLHKVFQYFYAGTEKILCSIDDSKAVEADRATWGLAPGQDRLNNQCWFKVADDHDISRDDSPTTKPSPAKQMRMLLTAGGPGASEPSDPLGRPTSALREPSKGKSSLTRSAFYKQGGTVTGLKSLDDDKKQQMTAIRRKQLALKRQQVPFGPGILTAADPFFWFCHGDFYLYTFPANQVPRSLLQDPTTVTCRYADFVSRSGTPVRRSDAALPAEAEDAPPSSCLCQPTDMTDHLRKRWEVPVVFPDEQRLLLGDSGWFPGALGFRFVFEASTESVERYVLLDTMPQASLVYMQHVWRPDKKGLKVNPKEARREQGVYKVRKDIHSSESSGEEDDSDASDSKDEEPFTAAHRRRLPYFYKRKKGTKCPQKEDGEEDKSGWETVDYMLPPLPAG